MVGFTIALKKRNTKKRYKNKKRKNYIYFLPVILIAIFSVFATGLTEEKVEESVSRPTDGIQVFREINDYSAYYSPVVMNGFFSYRNGDKIENEKLLEIAVWSILCTEKKEKYQLFDGELNIPEEDVKQRIRQLFSETVGYENTSINNIVYDGKSNCYIVPTTGFFSEYSGILKSVTAEKDRIKLSVECLRSDAFKQDSSGKTVFPEAEKNITIILKKSKDSYYIESIYEDKDS